MTLKQLLIDGHIPEQSIEWVEGLLILIGIAMIVIGFIAAIRNMNKSSKKDFDERLNKERDDIKRSVVIDETLKDLRISVDNLSKSIYEKGMAYYEQYKADMVKFYNDNKAEAERLAKEVEAK